MFLWICLCYEIIDSILASFFSDNIFVPVLMISGNALILLLTFLFMRHNYLIVRDQDLEERYQKMEEAKARKLLREEQMTRMARVDSLTGAFVRRYGMELFESYLKQNISLTAVYIDLDELKKINDTKGHSSGDIYLKTFVKTMKKNLGKDDLLVRIGGDEFLLVFLETGYEETVDKLTKIRGSVILYAEIIRCNDCSCSIVLLLLLSIFYFSRENHGTERKAQNCRYFYIWY